MDANNQATETTAGTVKILGTECISTHPLITSVQQQNNNVKTELSVYVQMSDTENQLFDDHAASNDDEQSSEQSNDASTDRNKPQHSSKVSSPTSENTLDDRRLRRQIANCNERRRMQSINAGFQALRQFLPQSEFTRALDPRLINCSIKDAVRNFQRQQFSNKRPS